MQLHAPVYLPSVSSPQYSQYDQQHRDNDNRVDNHNQSNGPAGDAAMFCPNRWFCGGWWLWGYIVI